MRCASMHTMHTRELSSYFVGLGDTGLGDVVTKCPRVTRDNSQADLCIKWLSVYFRIIF